MANYMLIDTTTVEETRLLLVAPIREVQLWGRYYGIKGRTVIAPEVGGAGFAKLELDQLQYLLWNTFGQAPEPNYGDLLANCKALVEQMEPDTTPLKDLEKMVEAVRPEPVEGVVAAKPKKQKKAGDGSGRPASGTCTGAVWDLCDELTKKLGREPERKEAIAFCTEDGGIHRATASTQYAKWKKASKKEEKGA